MVDSVNPSGQPPPAKGVQNTPKTPSQPQPLSTDQSDSKHTPVPKFIKTMFPTATPKQQEQMWNNITKTIADQIKRDQTFHEDQKAERDSEEDDS